jgi:hypothetical protein
MAAAASLSEPYVLAHVKERLFPDDAEGYAIVDTQFAREQWLAGRSIPARIRERLAPFNHVRVGTGYPDLVGVRALAPELLATDVTGDQPPLLAVEAKGYTNTDTDAGGVDVERGIVQAYDRLEEANVVFAAAPVDAIPTSARTLARELNVGLLGVAADGTVAPLETPHVVGNRQSDDAVAIRFQATAQGVADQSFGLNHPKNYLAYPLAVVHPDATDAVLADRVVRAVDGARTGAAFLGLIDERPDGVALTPLGREVVRFALTRYGSVDAALDAFAEWKRSRTRFCELAPEWGLVSRRVVWAYPATQLIVEELQQMHDAGHEAPSLAEVVQWLHASHPTFTVELFVRGTDDARGRVLDADGTLQPDALTDGDVYHAPTVFQLKAMLYHAGILTTRGAEPHRLDPTTDTWALRTPLDR